MTPDITDVQALSPPLAAGNDLLSIAELATIRVGMSRRAKIGIGDSVRLAIGGLTIRAIVVGQQFHPRSRRNPASVDLMPTGKLSQGKTRPRVSLMSRDRRVIASRKGGPLRMPTAWTPTRTACQ